MNFGLYHSGYSTRKPLPTKRVWGSGRGQKAALFLVEDASRKEAIDLVLKEGFERALIEVK